MVGSKPASTFDGFFNTIRRSSQSLVARTSMVPRLEAAANSDRSAKTGDEATILCKMTRQVFEGPGVIQDYI